MRIVLIILSLTALMFVWWLGMSIAGKAQLGWGFNTVTNLGNTSNVSELTIEQLKHQLKTEQELADIKAQLAQITGANTTTQKPLVTIEGATPENQTNSGEIIPVSAKFLWKILPMIELTKTDNSGIFDLHTFDNTAYTIYVDNKFGITVVASLLPYETFLKNFQALDPTVYTVNTKTPFAFDSFYVNPPVSDSTVRIVMKVEAQTLLVSLPKSKFNTFKELILKENS